MSRESNFIESASTEQRYPSSVDFERIRSSLSSNLRRVSIAQSITNSQQNILRQASQQLFEKYPYILLSTGGVYDETKVAAYLKDLDFYLQVIICAMIDNNFSILSNFDLGSIQELYKSFGISRSVIVEGIRSVQKACTTFLTKEDATETEKYFNYLVDVFFANQEKMPEAQAALPIWKEIIEIGAEVPDEEWAKIPSDLSKNHDHYLYGVPKDDT